jgi:hypothetical protein
VKHAIANLATWNLQQTRACSTSPRTCQGGRRLIPPHLMSGGKTPKFALYCGRSALCTFLEFCTQGNSCGRLVKKADCHYNNLGRGSNAKIANRRR